MADDYADPTKLSPGSNYGYVPFEQTRDARRMGEDRPPTYQDVEASIRADPDSKFSTRQTQLTQDLMANNALRYQASNPKDGVPLSADAYLDVGTTTILDHNEALAREIPGVYTTQSNGMKGLANTYSTLANAIQTRTDTLAGTWESDSAKPQFLSWVGKSTYSLREWAAAAGQNATVLANLATAVTSAKTQMATLMAQFEAESQAARAAATAAAGIPDASTGGGIIGPVNAGRLSAIQQAKSGQSAQWGGFFDSALAGGNPQAQVLEKYTQLSRSGPMATVENGFAAARQGIRVDGPVWRGPIDATPPPAFTGAGLGTGAPRPGAPGAPGMPGVPGAGVPSMPSPGVPGAPGANGTPTVPAGLANALAGLQRTGAEGLGSFLPEGQQVGTWLPMAAVPGAGAANQAADLAARQAELQAQLAAQQQAAAQQTAALQGSLASAQGLQGSLAAPVVSPALLGSLGAANALLGSTQAARAGASPAVPAIPPGLNPGAVPSAGAPGQLAPGIPPGLSAPLRPGMPGMPQVPGAGLPPGAGAPPMGRTALPGRNAPAMPRVPSASAPTLPGRSVPGVPALPGSPGSGPAPALPGRGAPPRTPGLPAVPGQPGAGGSRGPGAPGQPRVGLPQPPGVPGTGRPGTPGQPGIGLPRPPGVPGTGRPGAPGQPGLGRPLSGTSPGGGPPGGRVPGMPGVPPTQGMPRSLAGRNLDGVRNLVRGPLRMPGSFVVPEGPASAVPPSSGLGGRGAPLSRRPENLERARAATRRTLQGRMINDTEAGRQARNALRTTGPQAVPPGSTGRRKDDREEPLKKIGQIDNHELFDVEASGNGVIDRTAAPLAVKSGPALGGS